MPGSDRFYIGADPGNPRRLIWLPVRERNAHMTVLGQSGSGKSNFDRSNAGGP